MTTSRFLTAVLIAVTIGAVSAEEIALHHTRSCSTQLSSPNGPSAWTGQESDLIWNDNAPRPDQTKAWKTFHSSDGSYEFEYPEIFSVELRQFGEVRLVYNEHGTAYGDLVASYAKAGGLQGFFTIRPIQSYRDYVLNDIRDGEPGFSQSFRFYNSRVNSYYVVEQLGAPQPDGTPERGVFNYFIGKGVIEIFFTSERTLTHIDNPSSYYPLIAHSFQITNPALFLSQADRQQPE